MLSKKTIPLNREPVYRDLQKELRKRIHQGHWRKGAMIPSRRALADEFQVSIPTVQKAVADMVAEGLLRVNAKRGTYVFGDPDPEPEALLSDSASAHRGLDDARTLGMIDGHVSLIADIRPGATSLFASGWSFVIIHEAEYALAQYGIQSRFANRFDAHRKLGGTENSTAQEDSAASRALLETVLAQKPVAVILHESVIRSSDRALLRQILQAGIYTIVIGDEDFGDEFVSVRYDSANAGYQAAKHLIEQGCRQLLFFSAFHADWVESRAAGARLAVEAAGLPPEALRIAIGPMTIETFLDEARDPHPHIPAAYHYAQEILSGDLATDGIIAANDDAAFGFIRAARERGLQMGADYSLVGFDDSPESQALGLTTLHPPCASMGREAARAVVRLLRGQDDLASVVLKSRLVVRASSARRQAAG